MKTNDQKKYGEHSAEVQVITEVAREFIEAWYSADADRMENSLHPELVKRSLYRDSKDGTMRLRRSANAAMLIGWTEEGGESDLASEDQIYKITVFDTFRHIASVKVESHTYVDYLHVAKIEGSWKIVNDLWQLKEGELTEG
ncbi:MAG: nuclear transport factor 2 family protein [Anaerolineales bacterium]|jgi:hypothetical protein